MENDFVNLIDINQNEVLRYLGYKGQDINENLKSTINECISLSKESINPRYMLRVYTLNKENITINLNETNLNLESKDLYNLLSDCDECIIVAATLGIEIDKIIKRYSYSELTKGIIIDACATTAIEEFCDLIQESIKVKMESQGKFITSRYSPGYGDLSIDKNMEIINLLNAQKEIGLTITQSKIMIPRKSVIAIIGVSTVKKCEVKRKCIDCSNYESCKYRKGDESCGDKRIYKE